MIVQNTPSPFLNFPLVRCVYRRVLLIGLPVAGVLAFKDTLTKNWESVLLAFPFFLTVSSLHYWSAYLLSIWDFNVVIPSQTITFALIILAKGCESFLMDPLQLWKNCVMLSLGYGYLSKILDIAVDYSKKIEKRELQNHDAEIAETMGDSFGDFANRFFLGLVVTGKFDFADFKSGDYKTILFFFMSNIVFNLSRFVQLPDFLKDFSLYFYIFLVEQELLSRLFSLIGLLTTFGILFPRYFVRRRLSLPQQGLFDFLLLLFFLATGSRNNEIAIDDSEIFILMAIDSVGATVDIASSVNQNKESQAEYEELDTYGNSLKGLIRYIFILKCFSIARVPEGSMAISSYAEPFVLWLFFVSFCTAAYYTYLHINGSDRPTMSVIISCLILFTSFPFSVGPSPLQKCLAISLNYLGTGYDNSKKIIEREGKESNENYETAVLFDLVGDLLKDVAVPFLTAVLIL